MPTYAKAHKSVTQMAGSLLKKYHEPLVEAGIRIDFVFAYADLDENDEPINNAITHQGYPAGGLCRIINLKDRAKGNGDAEITLDAVAWDNLTELEKNALLDHELHHLTLGKGVDDLRRPKLRMRKHDVQIGWFSLIAERHQAASAERRQATIVMVEKGQYFWPELVNQQNGQASRMQKIETKG